ncbi:MAG TPA: molybdenum cofactor guanylyltransferase [Candidatus Baltobacteraceae bacterium]|jgi:molybdopterin-guanine dinucleotide biosynthesis protein A|nr:molybdenum cofactor guanylyltransferase [Candidatus Baltobacteraceae bacterium]
MDPGDRLAVVILAGGEATRLPGKLELDADGLPLLVRVYRNVAPVGPVYVAANRSFPAPIDDLLDCPVVIDRWPGRGPLGGLASAFAMAGEARAFVVAGDAPFADAQTAAELLAAWEPGIQAVVPVNGAGILEPLCAIYDRAAFLAAALPLLRRSSGGVAAAVEHLHAKRVRLSNERAFANVNTAADRQSLL